MNTIPIWTTDEEQGVKEAPSQRFFDYERLLQTIGDPELSAIESLPIFQKEFLLHTGESGRFTLDLRDVILGGGMLVDNISTSALEHAVQKSTALELTCIAALDQLQDLKARIDTDFELWMATVRTLKEAEIQKNRISEIAIKIRTQIGNITAQQINDAILTDENLVSDYKRFTELQNTARIEIKYLDELLITVRHRAMRVMHILNRRIPK